MVFSAASNKQNKKSSDLQGIWQNIQESKHWLEERLGEFKPEVALILGSGLGSLAEHLDKEVATFSYESIPWMPTSSVVGHEGKLLFGYMQKRPVVLCKGRVHLYEGRHVSEVVYGVRLLWALGVKTLVVSNAAGGIRSTFKAGDLMLLDDHLNLTGQNPLIGPHDERFGVRFPDMTQAYSPALRRLAMEAAQKEDLSIQHGVYAGLLGPNYETPAEIRYLASIGADAVGMSTVAEVIVARHLGMDVLGLSLISNLAAGLGQQTLHHEEVIQTADQSQGVLRRLVLGFLRQLPSRG